MRELTLRSAREQVLYRRTFAALPAAACCGVLEAPCARVDAVLEQVLPRAASPPSLPLPIIPSPVPPSTNGSTLGAGPITADYTLQFERMASKSRAASARTAPQAASRARARGRGSPARWLLRRAILVHHGTTIAGRARRAACAVRRRPAGADGPLWGRQGHADRSRCRARPGQRRCRRSWAGRCRRSASSGPC